MCVCGVSLSPIILPLALLFIRRLSNYPIHMMAHTHILREHSYTEQLYSVFTSAAAQFSSATASWHAWHFSTRFFASANLAKREEQRAAQTNSPRPAFIPSISFSAQGHNYALRMHMNFRWILEAHLKESTHFSIGLPFKWHRRQCRDRELHN